LFVRSAKGKGVGSKQHRLIVGRSAPTRKKMTIRWLPKNDTRPHSSGKERGGGGSEIKSKTRKGRSEGKGVRIYLKVGNSRKGHLTTEARTASVTRKGKRVGRHGTKMYSLKVKPSIGR